MGLCSRGCMIYTSSPSSSPLSDDNRAGVVTLQSIHFCCLRFSKSYILLRTLVVHPGQLVAISFRNRSSDPSIVYLGGAVHHPSGVWLVGEWIRPVYEVADACGGDAYKAAYDYILLVMSL